MDSVNPIGPPLPGVIPDIPPQYPIKWLNQMMPEPHPAYLQTMGLPVSFSTYNNPNKRNNKRANKPGQGSFYHNHQYDPRQPKLAAPGNQCSYQTDNNGMLVDPDQCDADRDNEYYENNIKYYEQGHNEYYGQEHNEYYEQGHYEYYEDNQHYDQNQRDNESSHDNNVPSYLQTDEQNAYDEDGPDEESQLRDMYYANIGGQPAPAPASREHYYQLAPKQTDACDDAATVKKRKAEADERRKQRLKRRYGDRFCDTCEVGFYDYKEYEWHLKNHVKCQWCDAEGSVEFLDAHFTKAHILHPNAPRIIDTAEWVKQRKANYCTVQRKKLNDAIIKKQRERGELIGLADHDAPNRDGTYDTSDRRANRYDRTANKNDRRADTNDRTDNRNQRYPKQNRNQHENNQQIDPTKVDSKEYESVNVKNWKGQHKRKYNASSEQVQNKRAQPAPWNLYSDDTVLVTRIPAFEGIQRYAEEQVAQSSLEAAILNETNVDEDGQDLPTFDISDEEDYLPTPSTNIVVSPTNVVAFPSNVVASSSIAITTNTATTTITSSGITLDYRCKSTDAGRVEQQNDHASGTCAKGGGGGRTHTITAVGTASGALGLLMGDYGSDSEENEDGEGDGNKDSVVCDAPAPLCASYNTNHGSQIGHNIENSASKNSSEQETECDNINSKQESSTLNSTNATSDSEEEEDDTRECNINSPPKKRNRRGKRGKKKSKQNNTSNSNTADLAASALIKLTKDTPERDNVGVNTNSCTGGGSTCSIAPHLIPINRVFRDIEDTTDECYFPSLPAPVEKEKSIASLYINEKYKQFQRKYQTSLLEKLLKQEIIHERNVLLQCAKFIVENAFFEQQTISGASKCADTDKDDTSETLDENEKSNDVKCADTDKYDRSDTLDENEKSDDVKCADTDKYDRSDTLDENEKSDDLEIVNKTSDDVKL